MNTCPICGKEHDGSYGSGKFCSKHCRYVYIGKQTKNHVCNFPKAKGRGNWKCCWCGEIFETKLKLIEHKKLFHKNHPAWNKGLTKETSNIVAKSAITLKQRYESGELVGSFKGKHHSEKTKAQLSELRKEYLEKHSDKVPYLLNHSSSISYPEQYFIDLFEKEKINLDYHYQCGKYQLDFYNLDKKIFVEIDGEQHYVDKKIIKSDKLRNQFFNEQGWSGLRIRWSFYQSLTFSEKHKIIEKIREFLLNQKIEIIPFENIFSVI